MPDAVAASSATIAVSAESQLEGFIAKFTPEIQDLAHAILDKMRARLPGAYQLVYDNYNALAIGFGPTERTSEAVFSIALYPRWVTLFFFVGTDIPDPHRLLKGSGKTCRHLVLNSAEVLDRPEVQDLIAAALEMAGVTMDGHEPGHLIIKSISAKQRPRRPK